MPQFAGLARTLSLPAALCAAFLVAPVAAEAPALKALGSLEPGRWEVRFRDGGPPRLVCVRSGHDLIQLQHAAGGCSRFVVEDAADHATVQYTCRGNGYGRTTIRTESPRLAQLTSSGIADGLPFELAAEARRLGSCT